MILLPSQRRQRILEDIFMGAGQIATLSQKYGVSEMTIRRDLARLAGDGHIRRTHGGAVRHDPAPPGSKIVARDKRQTLAAPQKRWIARYAARHFVSDGDILILESGTTATAMVPFLADKQELTVVTNGLETLWALQAIMPASTTIVSAGGILRQEASSFVGPVPERFFRAFHANRLFLSATGMMLEEGLMDPSMLETQVKQAMVGSASQLIVLLDSSKLGVKSLMTIVGIEEIGALITDAGCPEPMQAALRARGVSVHVAGEE